jgi:hypothetical protein
LSCFVKGALERASCPCIEDIEVFIEVIEVIGGIEVIAKIRL